MKQKCNIVNMAHASHRVAKYPFCGLQIAKSVLVCPMLEVVLDSLQVIESTSQKFDIQNCLMKVGL